MPRPPRLHVQNRPLMELCNRVCLGFDLLAPDDTFNALVVGALAKAQERYPVAIHAGQVLSDHFHLLISPTDVEEQAGFMAVFTRHLSMIAGRRHGHLGPLFTERYRATEVVDVEAAQVARLKYVLGNGCKEGLVASPLEWPGVPFAGAMSSGEPLKGIWVDREALHMARRRGELVDELDFAEEVELVLEPLPCWAHLSRREHAEAVRGVIHAVEQETAAMHQVDGTLPAGRERVKKANPWTPRPLERRPCPWIYGVSKERVRELLKALAAKVAEYREASARLRSGDRLVVFPPNCFPPALSFVPLSPVPGVPVPGNPEIAGGAPPGRT